MVAREGRGRGIFRCVVVWLCVGTHDVGVAGEFVGGVGKRQRRVGEEERWTGRDGRVGMEGGRGFVLEEGLGGRGGTRILR